MESNIQQSPNFLKGRGAQINPASRFDKYIYDADPFAYMEREQSQVKTQYIDAHPKSIVNKVESPDIPMDFSINPYQGCEHGCIYCYARNTHPFWGYSAGLEFEQKILIKKSAPELLIKKLKSKKWQARPIMLSGNTDCYQPAEKEYKITRELLKIFLRYRHPVGIITKNSLILRDLDIISELQKYNLVHVAISMTTLSEELRKFMEPRTATVAQRLKTIEMLSKVGVPVRCMIAPIIPGLNDHEVLAIAKKAGEAGASRLGSTMIRLNGDVAQIFEDWIKKVYPDRAEKVMNKIKEVHGGQLSDSRFGTRMKGEGSIAEIIEQQMDFARRRYLDDKEYTPLNCDLHEDFKSDQLKLF